MTAPKPQNEDLRLAALRRLNVLDTPPEERFDRITRSAAEVLNTPTALISLVDSERQWFRSAHGLDSKETPRSAAFCAHAILKDEPLVVADASQDDRFANNPLVTGPPHIRFYAGVPIKSIDDYPVGTMCILDREPRMLREGERELLQLYAAWAESELNSVEARKALAECQRVGSYLDAIVGSMSELVVISDAQGAIEFCNRAAGDMFGEESEALIGANLSALLPPPYDDRDGYERYIADAKSGRFRDGETMRKIDGTAISVERSVSHVVTEHGLRHVHVIRDVSARRETDRLKSDFLSDAAHELRSPLSSIYGFAELLLHRKFDEKQGRELLEIIYNQSGQMTRLINELLDLARIEARAGRAFDMRTTAIGPIVDAAVIAFAVPQRRRPPIVSQAPDLPLVHVDPDKLQQALTNLISNAYKYSPPTSEVRVDVAPDADAKFLRIVVADEGIGMSNSELQQVFTRFFRADKTASVRGTGLGMTLVKEIIEHHGGRIELASKPHEGTQVVLLLPVAS